MLLAIKWKYITPLKHLIYKIKICNHDFLNRRIHYLSAASTVMSPLRKGKPEVTAHTGGCLTVRDPYRGHMPHPQGIKPCSLGLFCWCIGFGCRIRIYSTSHWNYIPIHMCISKPCFTITCTSLALYVEKSLKLNYHKLTKNVFILPSQIYIQLNCIATVTRIKGSMTEQLNSW